MCCCITVVWYDVLRYLHTICDCCTCYGRCFWILLLMLFIWNKFKGWWKEEKKEKEKRRRRRVREYVDAGPQLKPKFEPCTSHLSYPVMSKVTLFALSRGDLLSAIRGAGAGGKKLKKAVTVDKFVGKKIDFMISKMIFYKNYCASPASIY